MHAGVDGNVRNINWVSHISATLHLDKSVDIFSNENLFQFLIKFFWTISKSEDVKTNMCINLLMS